MHLNPIQSAQNPNYRRWKSCLETAGIREHSLFILSGKKIVREFLQDHRARVSEILFPPALTKEHRLHAQFHGEEEARHSQAGADLFFPELSAAMMESKTGLRLRGYQLTSRLFEGLDIFGTHYPLVVGSIEDSLTGSMIGAQLPAPKGLEVILALQDPANLGAAIRSCAALGASRVILTRECASPYLPKALRAASGMTFQIPLRTAGPLETYLSPVAANAPHVRALDMKGESLAQAKWPHDVYLILGTEGRGLDGHYAGPRVAIPMRPGCESLNAVQALTVALFRHVQLHGLDQKS